MALTHARPSGVGGDEAPGRPECHSAAGSGNGTDRPSTALLGNRGRAPGRIRARRVCCRPSDMPFALFHGPIQRKRLTSALAQPAADELKLPSCSSWHDGGAPVGTRRANKTQRVILFLHPPCPIACVPRAVVGGAVGVCRLSLAPRRRRRFVSVSVSVHRAHSTTPHHTRPQPGATQARDETRPCDTTRAHTQLHGASRAAAGPPAPHHITSHTARSSRRRRTTGAGMAATTSAARPLRPRPSVCYGGGEEVAATPARRDSRRTLWVNPLMQSVIEQARRAEPPSDEKVRGREAGALRASEVSS